MHYIRRAITAQNVIKLSANSNAMNSHTVLSVHCMLLTKNGPTVLTIHVAIHISDKKLLGEILRNMPIGRVLFCTFSNVDPCGSSELNFAKHAVLVITFDMNTLNVKKII